MDQVRLIAPQETHVLLTGETGTGKTWLARLIHELSPRGAAPYLVVNCGALSENLIESEMFGHVKGAFTGAERDRLGKFADVGRGTLLLDEVDALPLALQAKLLRAVEERVFEPVGSNRSQPMQARLVVASNRPLNAEVAAGRFRADLFFRLNVVEFRLPPLRERREVIRPLASRFLQEFSSRNGRDVRGITPEAMAVLEHYPWPGNLRELRNVIERATSLCPGREIHLADLPDTMRGHDMPPPASDATGSRDHQAAPTLRLPLPGPRPGHASLARTKEEAEVGRIIEALERHGDNRLRAALELGISRMTLYKKLHKYGLMEPQRPSTPARAGRFVGRAMANGATG